MPTRVTNNQTTTIFIDQIFQQRRQLESTRQKISSGLDVAKASDDPGRASTISALQNTNLRLDQHEKRISLAQGFLAQQETTLASAEDLMERAREIATQAANQTVSSTQREFMSQEIFQIKSQLMSLANSTYQGRFLWGGSADDTQPFVAQTYTDPPAPALANERVVFDAAAPGRSLTRTIQASDSDVVRTNTAGAQVWSDAISNLEILGRSMAGYASTLTAGVPDGGGVAYVFPADYATQTDTIRTAMDAIESARSSDIVRERVDVGTRISRLDQVTKVLGQIRQTTEESRARVQDADIFEVAARYTNMQTALQGLLTSGARINDLSLLNFLP